MNKFIKYNFTKYNKKNYLNFLNKIISKNYRGIIINAVNSNAVIKKSNFLEEFHSHISEMIVLAHQKKILTALELNIFESKYIWQHENFSPPISSNGAEFISNNNYYPICPNNKLSSDRFVKLIDHFSNIIPDYFIISEFRFPYNWTDNPLDLQDKIPNFCYCPYCISEFSSEIGVAISDLNSLYDNISDWMQWRFEVMDDYFNYMLEKLIVKKCLVIQVPPLNLVDIPFSTGQVLLEYGESGAKISPLLFHKAKNKDPFWALEVLDVFKIDIPDEIIIPSIQINDINSPEEIFPAYDEYDDIFIY